MKKRNVPIYRNVLPDVTEGIYISWKERENPLNALYEQYLKTENPYESNMYFIGIDAEEVGQYLDAVIQEIMNIDRLICLGDNDFLGLAPKNVFCFDTEESCERFIGYYQSLKDEELITQYRLMYGSYQHSINIISYKEVRDRRIVYSSISEDRELFREKERVIKTGYYKWDTVLGGIEKGKVYVLAAREKMGKTDFVLTMAKHVAVDNKDNVWYMISKYNEQQDFLINKLVNAMAKIKTEERCGGMSVEQWHRGYDTICEIESSPLHFVNKEYMDVFDVINTIHMNAVSSGLVIIDDLMTLASNLPIEASIKEKLDCTLNEIKKIAVEMDIPICVTTDVKKSVDKKDNKFPNMEDIKCSEQIAMYADVIITMYRDEYYDFYTDKKAIAEFKIFENDYRGNIDIHPMRLMYAWPYSTFYNLLEE